MFVEDMSRLFSTVEAGMNKATKMAQLMGGTKELFTVLVRSPLTTVADFVREASAMRRLLKHRAMKYGVQQSWMFALGLSKNERAQRELVHSVIHQ